MIGCGVFFLLRVFFLLWITEKENDGNEKESDEKVSESNENENEGEHNKHPTQFTVTRKHHSFFFGL